MSQGFFDGFDEFDEYERRKERARQQQAEQSLSGRDIAPLPEVADPEARERCRYDFRAFCERYGGETFTLAWSPDHLVAIAKLQTVVLQGGQFALAMPRGTGKTSLVIWAIIWAASYGHRRFIVSVGATQDHSNDVVETIRMQFETNELLAADFPAVSYPVRRLDGISNRAAGQLLNKRRTHIKWTGNRLVFPTVDGAESSGVVIHATSLTGRLRGLVHTRPDGATVRPDLVIPDDPQTDESARMPAQTATRMRTINQAVLGLAGPGQKIAVLCPCTVICPGDLADQLLNKDLNPEWGGQKTQLLPAMPERMDLWERYREIRKESLKEHDNIGAATEFYQAHYEEMRRGAVVSWPERYESDHIDGLQYAMDLWAKDEDAFLAEYQNTPRAIAEEGTITLLASELLERNSGIGRGVIPDGTVCLTAFIDVQQDVLPWIVVAWGADMGGQIIDFGVWPEQNKRYWTLRNLSTTLTAATRHGTLEAALSEALDTLGSDLLGREYRAADAVRRIDALGVDANWNESTELVYQWCRAKHDGRAIPCHGRFFGAASKPLDEKSKKRGERIGHFWRWELGERKQGHLIVDANAWKSIVCKRLQVPRGESGGIWLFGDNPLTHECLVDQLSAEYGVTVTGRGRTVTEWKNRPGRDNHYWDGLTGCAALAQYVGKVELPGQVQTFRKRRRVSLAEQQRRKRL